MTYDPKAAEESTPGAEKGAGAYRMDGSLLVCQMEGVDKR